MVNGRCLRLFYMIYAETITSINFLWFRGNGMVADVYAETPPMSTYLLAFIVCDFKKISKTTKNNITVSNHSIKEQNSQIGKTT